MIIHQRTFQCTVGHADQEVKLVKDVKRITDAVGVQAQAERVYTDLTGRNDRVIWQVEVERMAEWEAAGPTFFGQLDFAGWFEQLSSHIEGSEAEFFTLQ